MPAWGHAGPTRRRSRHGDSAQAPRQSACPRSLCTKPASGTRLQMPLCILLMQALSSSCHDTDVCTAVHMLMYACARSGSVGKVHTRTCAHTHMLHPVQARPPDSCSSEARPALPDPEQTQLPPDPRVTVRWSQDPHSLHSAPPSCPFPGGHHLPTATPRAPAPLIGLATQQPEMCPSWRKTLVIYGVSDF